METKSQNKIYIDFTKPFYYPGEQILASLFLDIIDTVNSNKLIIVVKGKKITKIKNPNLYLDPYEDSEDEIEINDNSKIINEEEISKKEALKDNKNFMIDENGQPWLIVNEGETLGDIVKRLEIIVLKN